MALRCSSTDRLVAVLGAVALALAAAGPGARPAAAQDQPPPRSVVELELELASSPQLYLRLRQEPVRLEVRSRGVVLAAIPIQKAVLLVASGEATTETAAAELALPTVWRVIDEPPDTWRRQIAPPTLRPYGAEGPPPTPTVIATERPSAFGVTTDSGWRIEVTDQPVPGATSRFGSAVASGWRSLLGRPEPRPPNRLVLVVEAESAQRLVHLLQPGRAVLLSGS